MFVGPSTCDTFATFESRSGLPALAGVGEAEDPDEAKATEPLLKGVVSRDWIESTRICGVWTATGYCTPVFGSIQKFGAVCELDDSETSRSLATSRIVSPRSSAAVRLTSTSSSGVSVTCARCTSTAPGMVATRDARLRAMARFAVWFPAGPVSRNDLANVLLDRREKALRFLDPGPRRGAHVKAHLPRVDAGKEVPPEEGNEAERGGDERDERDYEDLAMVKRRLQRAAVCVAQPLEPSFDAGTEPRDRTAPAAMVLLPQKVADERGNERAREEIRGEHREDHRHRERDEERTSRA